MKVCRCCRQSWPIESFRVMVGFARRAKCKACEANCRPGSPAHKSRVRRANAKRGTQRLTCRSCGLAFERPITRGRPPLRCDDCRGGEPTKPAALVLQRVLLGPCPCQVCRVPLTWNGWGWEDATGERHRCVGTVAA